MLVSERFYFLIENNNGANNCASYVSYSLTSIIGYLTTWFFYNDLQFDVADCELVPTQHFSKFAERNVTKLFLGFLEFWSIHRSVHLEINTNLGIIELNVITSSIRNE